MRNKIWIIIKALQPGMEEYSDNAKFEYWMSYAVELDEISYINHHDTDQMVEYVNKVMKDKVSTSAEHHACVDVATTLENLFPAFAGKFKYQ